VGDDAQSIYSFRGADIRNMTRFEEDWPDAKTVILDQNYRSTKVIINAAEALITHNRIQKEKHLWTDNIDGEPIKIVAKENERAESEFVVRTIEHLLRDGYTPSDMAILYRTNAQSRSVEESLLHHNVPYKIIGGVKFYQRKEIKDILAYLRVIVNPQDAVSIKRIANIPPRGIGKKLLLTYLMTSTAEVSTPSPTKPMNKKGGASLASFDQLIKELKLKAQEEPPTIFIKYLLNAIHYREYLDDNGDRPEERWENIQEFVSLAKRYDEEMRPGGLEKLLEDVALMAEGDSSDNIHDAIPLMTLHAAKGLEFPVVFMVGLEEGILPHARSTMSPHELEEERRLCYVGVTRAKEKVFLTFTASRISFGMSQVNPPSRFLSEIPQELCDLSLCSLHDDMRQTSYLDDI